jgi:hypothetical protein
MGSLANSASSAEVARTKSNQQNPSVSNDAAKFYRCGRMTSGRLGRVLFCCLGTTDRNEMELHSRRRHSDSRTVAACDSRPDHVWTWIQACKYFLESSWSLLSYTSNLKPISCRSRPQSLFWCRDLFLPMVLRHLILAHWAVYHVESNSDTSYGWSMTQPPRGRPPTPIKPSRRHLKHSCFVD